MRLWNGWHPEFNTFMRQKCCFYFQLEEAEQTLCRNCPLRLKEIGKFKDFRAAGINRVSMGVQSLRESELKFLGREHNSVEAIKSIS